MSLSQVAVQCILNNEVCFNKLFGYRGVSNVFSALFEEYIDDYLLLRDKVLLLSG